ncbi:MAG: 50S ribosomal protein L9 [Symbiobacteriia bacterium]
MKVILLQDVKGLGKKGAVAEVAEGYGRNFLMPRGLAAPASGGAMKSLEQERERERLKLVRLKEAAQALAKRLEGVKVTLPARVGEGGRLFGSITAKDVAEALRKSAGLEVDKRKVETDTIKTLGEHLVTVKLHPEVAAQVTVLVVEESRA